MTAALDMFYLLVENVFGGVFLTGLGLVALIVLIAAVTRMSIILTILVGLIFGSLTIHSITTLEDYNDKHHRLWSNALLFITLLIVSYSALKVVIDIFQINASAITYALIYKISFAIFPAYIIIKHEIEMNKHLEKIKRKIKRK